jgi:probable F420-dependent oxidoreductase
MSELGITLRIQGDLSTPAILRACARAADSAGLRELWVNDHVAIPPDDAEHSKGRYLDPLCSLAWIAAATERIGLGTAIINLPYRRPLLLAKAVATVQELSGGRLRLGVGVGWMEAEFRALGIDRSRRGQDADHALDVLARCFAADEVELNGQTFLFRPRPQRPEILVGGTSAAARARAVRAGDAWLPIGREPEELAAEIEHLRALATEAGRQPPAVVLLTRLPIEDPAAARERVAAFTDIGVARIGHLARYESTDDYRREVEAVAAL